MLKISSLWWIKASTTKQLCADSEETKEIKNNISQRSIILPWIYSKPKVREGSGQSKVYERRNQLSRLRSHWKDTAPVQTWGRGWLCPSCCECWHRPPCPGGSPSTSEWRAPQETWSWPEPPLQKGRWMPKSAVHLWPEWNRTCSLCAIVVPLSPCSSFTAFLRSLWKVNCVTSTPEILHFLTALRLQ